MVKALGDAPEHAIGRLGIVGLNLDALLGSGA